MPSNPLFHELTEALLPQRCLVCGRFGAALHESCVALLPAAEGPRCLRCWATGGSVCRRCQDSPPAFEARRARFRFEGDARRAILEAKFRGVTTLLDPLAEAAAESVPPAWRVGAVVPVPLHRKRERRRGYNQAALISKTVARRLSVPHRPDLLRRVRATPPQAGLDEEHRARNLIGAFEANGTVSGAVLLIDDVTTTGATFEAAATALQGMGAHTVFALAIAQED